MKLRRYHLRCTNTQTGEVYYKGEKYFSWEWSKTARGCARYNKLAAQAKAKRWNKGKGQDGLFVFDIVPAEEKR